MSGIKSQLHKGMKWTGASTGIITIFQITQFALLANQMSLGEFGLTGMITVIVVFAQIVLDLGLGSAVIQKERVTNTMLSTLFWLNIITGIGICVCLMLTSPLIAAFFQREELTSLVRVLALVFLIAPIGQQSQYLLQKDLRFYELGVAEVASNLVSFLTLLVLIFTISPIYSFVISQIVLYGLKGCLYYFFYKNWRPSLDFDLRQCKDLLCFGGFQLASRLVNKIGSNLDVVLIGRFLGAEALGIYHLAYQIVTIPVLKINPVLTRVAFPLFSKNQYSQQALKDGLLHMTKLLAVVTFPMLLGLIAVADVFVATIFGQKWLEAVPIVQIMALVGILRVLMNPNGSILLAKGKANLAFYYDSGVLVLYGASLLLAVTTENLEIVAWTYALVSLLNFIIGRQLLKWLIKLEWTAYLKSLAGPLGMAVLMAFTALLVKETASRFLPDLAAGQLAIGVTAGAAVYVLLLWLVFPASFSKRGKARHRGQNM
jgi:teichuronic acid exporter